MGLLTKGCLKIEATFFYRTKDVLKIHSQLHMVRYSIKIVKRQISKERQKTDPLKSTYPYGRAIDSHT